jgi:hypothetical protein
MKKITAFLFLIFFTFSLIGCVARVHRRRPLPPGHEKRLHDDQRAREYPPGRRNIPPGLEKEDEEDED